MIAKEIITAAYRTAWKSVFVFPGPLLARTKKPLLSYAGLCSGNKLPYYGGNVKLAALCGVFPEQTGELNLLYLISSGISVRAEAWADICVQRGIRLIWNQNGVAYPAWSPKDHRRLNSKMSRCMHSAAFVIYQSQFCKKAADHFLGEFMGPSTVMYNAVDTTVFAPVEASVRTESGPLRLLVMGSHESPERVMAALAAVALLKKDGLAVRLTIAGRLVWPGALNEVRAAVKSSDIDDLVELRGSYSQAEAPEIYRSADILLHLKYADPCPSVVIEAMACGLPVVASDSGGVPELIENDGGVLIPVPQDLESLHTPSADAVANAVKKAAGQLKLYSASARRRAVLYFDNVAWIERHRKIFEEVLRK